MQYIGLYRLDPQGCRCVSDEAESDFSGEDVCSLELKKMQGP
jgi:hypothetical protein